MTAGSGPKNAGTDRLLRDCAAFGRLTEDRAPARVRLAQKLGAPFARRLLANLRRRPPENGR